MVIILNPLGYDLLEVRYLLIYIYEEDIITSIPILIDILQYFKD